jgi:hypothetical protein
MHFPFICNNIPTAHVYRVYISQLIRYSRARGSYHDISLIEIAANKEATEPRFPSG